MSGDEIELETDDELFARLTGLAARLDPVPPAVLAAARATFALRTLADDLAELTYDSDLDDGALVGIRGGGGARQLTFEGSRLTIEMEVRAAEHAVIGQLVPPQEARVEVLHRGGSLIVDADPLGRFAGRGIPPGPVSVRVEDRAGERTQTDWVVV